MQSSKKIRVGILLNGLSTGAWAYDVLKEISESDYAEIGLVILNGGKSKNKKRGLKAYVNKFNYLLSYVYERVDQKLFKAKPDALAGKDLHALLANVPVITVTPVSKGLSQWFPDEDINRIKSHHIDVIFRLGFSILKGDVLQAAPYGIWSLHHGDNKVNRGGPPGFWEMYLNEPVTGTVLQVLSEDLDNGIVLSKTWAATHKYSLNRSKSSLYWKSGRLFIRALQDLHKKGFEAMKQIHRRDLYFYDRPKYTRPTNMQALGFMFRLSWRIMKKGVINLVKKNQWYLMFGLSKDGSMVQGMHKLKKIIPPADRFWADPFVVYREGRYYIFIEEMLAGEQDAYISVMEMDEKGNYTKPVKALETGYHLSYPFVFEYESNWYMMPETMRTNSVELFRCKKFPDQWEAFKTILPQVKAADPTLFQYNGKWWLFAAVADGSSISRNDELFIYYGDSPFGPFLPHAQNPVVSDVRRARPAGRIFSYKNKFYRPSQDCSVTYGYGIRLNEIVRLTETEYEEREADYIEPRWKKELNGTHTFCFEHNLTMIDVVQKR